VRFRDELLHELGRRERSGRDERRLVVHPR
jgi:hypothetical protein